MKDVTIIKDQGSRMYGLSIKGLMIKNRRRSKGCRQQKEIGKEKTKALLQKNIQKCHKKSHFLVGPILVDLTTFNFFVCTPK